MNAEMRFQEYSPPIELAPWIKLFWVFESRSSHPAPETIVADGFPELIIHFGSPFSERDCDGQLRKQSVAVACGQLTRPLELHHSLDAGMIGVRFQPNGMAPFISAPMKVLTDARVPADNLFVDIDRLVDDVMESSNDTQRVEACCQFLLRSIVVDRESTFLRGALDRITQSRGQTSVEALASLTGTSRRSLELVFQREIGTSPKTFCRITRFRHLFDAVSGGPPANWVQLALDSGFFDQSHLIRDFRQFAGDAPTSFLPIPTPFAHAVNQG